MQLYTSDFNTLEQRRGVCYVTRHAARFPTTQAIHEEYEALIARMAAASPIGLLLDLRAARGRNDLAFESALAQFRGRMLGMCKNTVILVQTAVGQLQLKRHMELDHLPHVIVVRDEAEARRLVVEGAQPA